MWYIYSKKSIKFRYLFLRLAERKGLPRWPQKPNKIRHFLPARGRRVYQSCVPKSMGFRSMRSTSVRRSDVPAPYQFEAVFPGGHKPAYRRGKENTGFDEAHS